MSDSTSSGPPEIGQVDTAASAALAGLDHALVTGQLTLAQKQKLGHLLYLVDRLAEDHRKCQAVEQGGTSGEALGHWLTYTEAERTVVRDVKLVVDQWGVVLAVPGAAVAEAASTAEQASGGAR